MHKTSQKCYYAPHSLPIHLRSSHTARNDVRLRRSKTAPDGADPPFFRLFQASLALMARIAGRWDRDNSQSCSGATVANQLALVEFVDVAHRLVPGVAAVKIEVPIEVKYLCPPRQPNRSGSLRKWRCISVRDSIGLTTGKPLRVFIRLDLLEDLDQFLRLVTDQLRIAETQIAGVQTGQRIAERATGKAERAQKLRQFVVVVDQSADGDARGGLHAQPGEHFVGAFDFAANIPATRGSGRAAPRRANRST